MGMKNSVNQFDDVYTMAENFEFINGKKHYKTADGYRYTRGDLLDDYDPMTPNHVPLQYKMHSMNLKEDVHSELQDFFSLYDPLASLECVEKTYTSEEVADFEKFLSDKMVPALSKKQNNASRTTHGKPLAVKIAPDPKCLPAFVHNIPLGAYDDEFCVVNKKLARVLPWVKEISEVEIRYLPLRYTPYDTRPTFALDDALFLAKKAGLILQRWVVVNHDEKRFDGSDAIQIMGTFRFVNLKDGDSGAGLEHIDKVGLDNIKAYVQDTVRTNLIFSLATSADVEHFAKKNLTSDSILKSEELSEIKIKFVAFYFSIH